MDNNLISKIRKRAVYRITGCLLMAILFTGCAHVISPEVLKEVDRGVTYENLTKDPERYQGKNILLGGVIIKAENKKDGTLLEIYETGLNNYGEPVNIDNSRGRFLAMDKRFLDTEIYREGRRVTVAGIANGIQVIKLGDIDYSYPYLLVKEIHLWKDEAPVRDIPYYWDYWHPYWGPWYPWHYPYWPYTRYYYNNTYRYYGNTDNSNNRQNDKGSVIQKGLEKTQGSRSQEDSKKIQSDKGSILEELLKKRQDSN